MHLPWPFWRRRSPSIFLIGVGQLLRWIILAAMSSLSRAAPTVRLPQRQDDATERAGNWGTHVPGRAHDPMEATTALPRRLPLPGMAPGKERKRWWANGLLSTTGTIADQPIPDLVDRCDHAEFPRLTVCELYVGCAHLLDNYHLSQSLVHPVLGGTPMPARHCPTWLSSCLPGR